MLILETKDLKYSYPDGTTAIRGIDIKIMRGKKTAFVGRNGSGKSTLFMLLNGTIKPKDGRILFNGNQLGYDRNSLRDIRKNVGIVFQNSDDQIFAPTVYQDVAFGPTNLGYSKEKVREKVTETLEYFGLTDLKDKPPHHLSGGQKKRVAIAGVVAMQPQVIILDEPLANLDPVGADELLDVLNTLNDSGTTLIISTHDVDLAHNWADHLYFMAKGKVIGEGTPDKVFNDPELIREAHLKSPITLDIYHEIERRGLAKPNQHPTSVPELVDTLKPPELMWVEVPTETREGDVLNLGVLHGEYALQSPYEAVNARVLHMHSDGRAVVEVVRHGIKAGGIAIYDLEQYDPDGFQRIMETEEIAMIGAMGKQSKMLAEKYHIPIQISSGVIDRTLLMALCGKRCLILTSGGMISHSMKRIDEYAQRSGIAINVSIVNHD
ncbi:MAG: energy-coupling factor ABC transporter ATP-binding protein [Methanosarcinaceae archaeon]